MKPLNKGFVKLSFPKHNKKTSKQLSPTLSPIIDPHVESSNENSNENSNNKRNSPQESPSDILQPLENIPKITIPENESDENPSPLPKSQSATELRAPTAVKAVRSSSQTDILHPNSTNRHPNCLSMISPSDSTKASTITPVRKHSLPPVMDLFADQKQLTRTYMTLAEFKRTDEFPRQQRAILATLQRQDNRLRKEGVIKEMKKASLRGKRDRKIAKAETVTSRSVSMVNRGSSSGSVALKFLGIKKGKKRTTSVLLNNLILAIKDHKTSDALAILPQISNAALKKKKNGEVNKAFLLAMAHRLEDITLSMYERGFPSDVNSPIFSKPKNTDRGGISGLKFPSYFILAVSLGLYDLVKAMLKRANMNQAWFGLTPLIIATAQSSRAPTKNRRSSTSDIIILIKLFLDHGADPSQGLPLEQFNTLRRLKAKKHMRNLEILNLLNSSVPHKNFSVPHQFGDNGMSAKKTKEDMEKFAKGKWVFPIDIAAISGDIDLVKILLSKMEESSIASSSFCLAIQNDVMLTLELVHAGANVNQKNFRGSTALHRAARSGHTEMVMVLIQLGADVTIKDDNDWTPLHEAISQKHLDVCPILVAAGADLTATNNSGKTPKELGIECGLTPELVDQCLNAINNTHSINNDKNKITMNQKHDPSISNGASHSPKKRFGTFPKKSQNFTSILMGSSSAESIKVRSNKN
ncbi:hypothetical protein RclHR1_02000012 [Rhizophagus clarus]|uniref:Uncharacterized protein n=1 Tax=Rhizophagus clarus TaxID=94130 RepID=A0A2Z6R632_9GLOM|nr:hypothetical protein RclHR1_02000012 [Rhizophagus clarus]